MMTVHGNQQLGNSVYFQQWISALDQTGEFGADLSAQDFAQVEKIFVRNYASGRAQRVMGQTSRCANGINTQRSALNFAPPMQELPAWAFAYLQKVVQTYRQEGVRLQAIAGGDRAAWNTLSLHLVDSAYKFLVRKGVSSMAANEMAQDMAQQTCLQIYLSFFPCDVAFDIWAHVILKNQILHGFMRSKDLLDRQPYIESLDELQTILEDHQILVPAGQLLNDTKVITGSNGVPIEDEEWLMAAIAQIPSLERRAVIIYTYFHAFGDDEIAVLLGKSKGAIHTLRHRALKQLQAILDKTAEQPT